MKLGHLIILIIISACTCSPPPPQLKIIPKPAGVESVSIGPENQSVSLSQGGVNIKVNSLDHRDLRKYSVTLRPLRPDEYNAPFKDGYVNYAQDENADLLRNYRLNQRYPSRLQYDAFGSEIHQDGWEINPYLDRKHRLLIFRVVVENKAKHKIEIRPSQSVLLDDQNHQYEAYRKEDWQQGFFPLIWSPGFITVAVGQAYDMVHFFMPRDVYLKERIVDASLLKDNRIYPGVTVEGLIVFPMVAEGVRDIRLVLPDVTFYNEENEVEKKKDFEYRFMIIIR